MAKTSAAVTIPCAATKFDLWRLSEVGGRIGFDKKGRPVFQFTSHEQYRRYLELNSRRGEVVV